MLIRRAFYYWQFIAAVAVPAWLLVGWGVFGGGGWQFVALIISCPVLCVAMFAISGIIAARKQVRETHAVSWLDVGLLTLWHAALIAIGTFTAATNLLIVAAIFIAIGAFWTTIWELLTEARKRVARVMGEFEAAAAKSRPEEPAAPTRSFDPHKPQDGQIYRLG